MAIQAAITTIQGVSLTTAYINISNPQIIKTKTDGVNSYSFGGNAQIFADKIAYDNGKIPIEGFSVVCPLDLTNDIFTQAYTALKLNARLSNMKDC